MRQFLKQILSAASLIVLFPTIILAPLVVYAMLPFIGVLLRLATDPLMAVWIGGYFLSVLVYLILLCPLPRSANFVLWCVPVVYLLLMLLLKPWSDLPGVLASGTTVDEGFANWAMGSLKILLPLALAGLWMERPRKKKLPPPFPGSGEEKAEQGNWSERVAAGSAGV